YVAGTDIHYTVTVKNQGPSDSAAHTVTDAVPAGTTFVSASPACAVSSGTVTCSSTGLAAGATESFTITFHVGSDYQDGGDLTNTASIGSATTSDPDHTNNSSTVTVKVTRQA